MANEGGRDPSELGALWIQTSARGDYMTGTVNGVKVVCFHNDKKTPGSKAPDWRVLKSKPREGQSGPRREPILDDDISF